MKEIYETPEMVFLLFYRLAAWWRRRNGALTEPVACGKKDYNIDFRLCQQPNDGKTAVLCGILPQLHICFPANAALPPVCDYVQSMCRIFIKNAEFQKSPVRFG